MGATKLSQLEENLKTINVVLTEEHIKILDAGSDFELGFPGEFYKEDGVKLGNFE